MVTKASLQRELQEEQTSGTVSVSEYTLSIYAVCIVLEVYVYTHKNIGSSMRAVGAIISCTKLALLRKEGKL